jgi:hypothetical protein
MISKACPYCAENLHSILCQCGAYRLVDAPDDTLTVDRDLDGKRYKIYRDDVVLTIPYHPLETITARASTELGLS